MDKKETKADELLRLKKKLKLDEEEIRDFQYPKISAIVATQNCAQIISNTVESILQQNYPDLELIIIDAGSTDRTIEVVKSFRDDRIRIYTVSGFKRYEMLNKGISQASGDYICFLFPGDFYLSREAFKIMMTHVLKHDSPHLVFCGALLRDGKTEVKILFRHLSPKLLRRGQQPTTLQSCWFRTDLFNLLGKFNTNLQLRGGFDFFCRYYLHQHFRTISTTQVLMDYDLRLVTRKMVITHFFETMSIVFKYFGIFSTIYWLIVQKDFFRFLKLWWRSFMLAFIGRKP